MALAVLAAVALRLVPAFTPVAGHWADLSVRQQLGRQIAAQAGKTVNEIEPQGLDREVDRLIAEHGVEIARAREALRQNYRDAITFLGEDERRHLYLGGYDGYYWLRLARAYLEHGTVCGAITGDECIDTAGNAPAGRAIEYVHSPFVMLIAGTHRVASLVAPGLPLSTSAGLLPIVLTCFAIIPCFLLGRRMGGAIAGLLASLVVFLNPFVFARTADADNDIMVVLLPLIAAWLLVEALDRRGLVYGLGLSALAGGALGLLAASWDGWPLYYLVSIASLAAVAAFALWKTARTVAFRALLALAGITAGLALTLFIFAVPLHAGEIAEHLLGTFRLNLAQGPLDTAPGADMFATIGELVPVNVATFADALGPLGLALGLVGFSLAMVPSGRLKLWGLLAALVVSTLLVLLGVAFDLGREGLIAGLAILLAGAALQCGPDAAMRSQRRKSRRFSPPSGLRQL
jgi:asparagine N-glycosylation enzyme membrane subunit Stt3